MSMRQPSLFLNSSNILGGLNSRDSTTFYNPDCSVLQKTQESVDTIFIDRGTFPTVTTNNQKLAVSTDKQPNFNMT